jgi:hypothetical protein
MMEFPVLSVGTNTWTPGQNARFVDTYDAYFGKYEIDWDSQSLTHTLQANLRPEKKTNTIQKKIYTGMGYFAIAELGLGTSV